MPKRSNKPVFNFQNTSFMQISESHCGPAVVQMLLSNLGVEVSQEAVAEAGGAKELIELNGMRVDQLALAVHLLAPQTQFWFKEHSKLRELVDLLHCYRVPVGVEWQGQFEDDEEGEGEAETGDEDYGHYSVITHADRRKKQLIIVDPYKDYIGQDRIFSFKEFKQRWWDYNEVPDPLTGEIRLVEDHHMMFIITPQEALFPLEFGMQKGP